MVGLLFRPGASSTLVQHLLDSAPKTGSEIALERGASAADFVRVAPGHYGYAGSLMTPPCGEGVRWVVVRYVGAVSGEQVSVLQALTGSPNNRPPQPIGGRDITAVAG